MSRSNNVELKNPAQRFLKWDGENGGFKFFDKSRGDKGENVRVELPFEFVVLDILSTVRGYDDFNKSGYWSNEVRNVGKDEIVIRNRGGIVTRGLYGEILPQCVGARYCQSVYILHLYENQWQIGNIQMMGSCVSAWIEFCKKHKIYEGSMLIPEALEGKKGITKYKYPRFEKHEITEEVEQLAINADKEVQDYLGKYFAKNKMENDAKREPSEQPEAMPIEQEEFEPQKEDLPF